MSALTLSSKRCTACGEDKPLDEFSANAANADGKQRHCKACIRDMHLRSRGNAEKKASGEEFSMLPIGQVVESLTNPRTTFNQAKLEELADSIRASGVHQPILVRVLPTNRLDETARKSGKEQRPAWELVAGARRLRASTLAGKTTIPAMIKPLTDDQVLEIQIVENLQRDDLTELEEAEGYQMLVDRTGTPKEDIGSKIGRSRSYVYQRLKLLDLCTAGREALRAEKIDASRAQLIARIPNDKLQVKALEEATRLLYNNEPAHSYRSFSQWVHQNVMLKLDTARFKITDAALLPDAGSCKECPKRTGANPDLFTDVNSADVCTDPTCFHAKAEAHDAAVLALAKARGQRVIGEKEAKSMWEWEHQDIKGFVRLDKPDRRVDDRKALKTVLGKNIPEPILLANPHKNGELIEVLPKATVNELLTERGKITPQQARSERVITDREAKIKALTKFELTWRKRAIVAVSQAMTDQQHGCELHVDILKAAAREATGGLRSDERSHLCEMLELGKVAPADAISSYIESANAVQAEQVLCLLLMHQDLINVVSWQEADKATKARRIEAVATAYQVDLAEIRDTVKGDMKDAAKEKAAKAKKSASPPAAGGDMTRDKPKSGKGFAAKAPAAPKTSTAEAQLGIAAALQAAEGEQDQAPDGAELTQGDALASPVQAAGAADLNEPAAPAAGAPSAVAWPFPGVALKPGVAAAAAPPASAAEGAPQMKIGQLARVKAGSKGPGGKLLKCCGRVGRVIGLGEDGRVHLKHGERKHELLVVDPWQIEAYTADPLIGSEVRVMSAGLLEHRLRFLWRQGVVKACLTDGWQVEFKGKTPNDAECMTFFTEELAVLA